MPATINTPEEAAQQASKAQKADAAKVYTRHARSDELLPDWPLIHDFIAGDRVV